MGLDSRINLIYPIADIKLKRYEGMNTRDIPYWLTDEDEFTNPRFDHVRALYKPLKVIETTWDMAKIKSSFHIPEEARMWRFGPSGMGFKWKQGDYECEKDIPVGLNDPQWNRDDEVIKYIVDSEELYMWNRNEVQDKIWELFNKEYPDEWCEYANEYRQYYAGYYPITEDIYKKMCKIDKELDKVIRGNLDGCYYSSDW